jgi:hypothetical protein
VARDVDADDLSEPAPGPSTRLSVFLCHASEDKAAARELARLVESFGHEPWLDDERLLPGQDWDQEIRRALKRADVVLICLSERAAKRGYVQKEIRGALEIAEEFPPGTLFLIPIRLTECTVPDALGHLHRVDLFLPGGSQRLADAIAFRANA